MHVKSESNKACILCLIESGSLVQQDRTKIEDCSYYCGSAITVGVFTGLGLLIVYLYLISQR